MDVSTRQAAEADLAGKAAQYRPDELARYAQRVMDWLHPDGDLTDTERARKRGITLSNQQYDGMSRLSGYLTPQARATFEAVLAKLAAPGATNPDDHTPVIDTTPDAAAIDRDTRSQAQRNHDGLLAGLRALIASGKLGQHNGLPVSIVVTTTLTDLQTGAGKGFTGGGTLLPMADVIRLCDHPSGVGGLRRRRERNQPRRARRRSRIAIHSNGVLRPHFGVLRLSDRDRRRVLTEKIGRNQRHHQNPIRRNHRRRHRHHKSGLISRRGRRGLHPRLLGPRRGLAQPGHIRRAAATIDNDAAPTHGAPVSSAITDA